MKSLNIKEINSQNLLKGKMFELPDYQREYSWNEDNWEEFLQNIESFVEDNKEEKEWTDKQKYFSGDIIVKEIKDKESYQVIDGQQRLVTIFIFLITVYKKSKNIKKKRDWKN